MGPHPLHRLPLHLRGRGRAARGAAWLATAAVACALGWALPVSAADLPADALAPLRARATLRRDWADDRGRLPLLVSLTSGAAPLDLGLLEVAPGVGAIWLTPSELAGFRQAHPGLRPVVAPWRRPLLDRSGRWTGSADFRALTGLDGTGVVVGVVDSGLDVSHPDFRNADGSSRVAWMLTGGLPLGRHPDLEQRFGCTAAAQASCAVWSAADIDEALRSPAPDDEPNDPTGHGTHVAAIAAANAGPMLGTEHRYVGVAPGATLVIAAPPSGTQFSDPFILNATRFVFERAEMAGMQAVVNVSLGSDFGAHDGTSELERGLAAMVGEAFPGRAIVLAAGNSGALYHDAGDGPFGIHTAAHTSPNGITRVPMTAPGWQGTLSGAAYVWITFQSGDDVEVGLEGPDGESWVDLTAVGEEDGYESEDGATVAGVINNTTGGNAGITPDTNSAVVVVDGSWPAEAELAVLLRGRGHADLWISATGDFAPGPLGLGLVFRKATRSSTIAVPASHPALIAVGCTLNRVSWRPAGTFQTLQLTSFGGVEDPEPDSSCYFSGAGPTPGGALKPDLLAPGAYVAAAMSRAVDPERTYGGLFDSGMCPPEFPGCQKVDARHAVAAGTSMSAPHVAGAIALLLQRDPMLTQGAILELLQAGAAHPSGAVPYDYQMGPGELDLVGSLQVLEDGRRDPPDAMASHYVIASPYLRADARWGVDVLVQLRTADGSIALGVTPSRVRLLVEGADVAEPLAMAGGGTLRAVIAAPNGSGGTLARLDVLVDGASLGARSLPVGVDEWAATSGVGVVGGGCSIAMAEGRPRSGELAWLLVVGGLAALARRRRGRGLPTEPPVAVGPPVVGAVRVPAPDAAAGPHAHGNGGGQQEWAVPLQKPAVSTPMQLHTWSLGACSQAHPVGVQVERQLWPDWSQVSM